VRDFIRGRFYITDCSLRVRKKLLAHKSINMEEKLPKGLTKINHLFAVSRKLVLGCEVIGQIHLTSGVAFLKH
jgi:hypothetical protein